MRVHDVPGSETEKRYDGVRESVALLARRCREEVPTTPLSLSSSYSPHCPLFPLCPSFSSPSAPSSPLPAHGKAPIHGVLGFSQGGILASLMCGLMHEQDAIPFRFALLISSFPARDPRWASYYSKVGPLHLSSSPLLLLLSVFPVCLD